MNVCEYNKVNTTNLIDSIIKAKYVDDAKIKHGAPILYYFPHLLINLLMFSFEVCSDEFETMC